MTAASVRSVEMTGKLVSDVAEWDGEVGGRGMLVAGVDCLRETKYKGGAHVWDPRYKRKQCANWEGSGGVFCPRGLRCDFAHGPVELRVTLPS